MNDFLLVFLFVSPFFLIYVVHVKEIKSALVFYKKYSKELKELTELLKKENDYTKQKNEILEAFILENIKETEQDKKVIVMYSEIEKSFYDNFPEYKIQKGL